ncbi:hypothetical protein DDE05_03510 [Streptomyces cavourensis]|nr:hypothetical protein DDE05_03510 [Streptomyces cavourensis]
MARFVPTLFASLFMIAASPALATGSSPAATSTASTCKPPSTMKLNESGEGFADPDLAIGQLSACLSRWADAPADVRAYTLEMRAVAYGQKEDYAHAIADREESLRLAPARTAWDIIALARAYRGGGQPERAVELLRKMLQDKMGLDGKGTTPGMPSYYHLGRALIDVQQWSSAADAFSEGLTYQQEYVWAYAYRSVAYDRLGRPERARADIDKARSLIGRSNPLAREEYRQIVQKPPFVELLKKYPEQGK